MIRSVAAAIVLSLAALGARAQIVPGPEVTAIEFYHAGFGHYFVSAQADEIAAVDLGLFAGWTRTGRRWNVWSSGTGLADVCRFFTTFFAPKSSHFYTANAGECEIVKNNPVWQYEKIAFKVGLRDGLGACPIGVPLYRVYNDGKTGAPNHRYTTSLAVRAQMLAAGYLQEDVNTVCVIPTARSPAEGFWLGSTSGGRTLVIVVLDDGNFAALYTPVGNIFSFAGAVQGGSTAVNGIFASTDGKDFSFAAHLVGAGSVNATFAPKGTMTGTIVTTTSNEVFTVTYSPTYETQASLPRSRARSRGRSSRRRPATSARSRWPPEPVPSRARRAGAR